MSRARFCIVCGNPIPESRGSRAKLCLNNACWLEVKRQRARAYAAKAKAAEAAALGQTNPPRVCSECSGALPRLTRSDKLTCSPVCAKARCRRKTNEAYARKRAAKSPPRVADAPPAVDWFSVLSRAAASGGPEFAQALATELNKHRRLNGHPEVRV